MALAERMATHGHAWHQTTVAKTESGERRLLLGEAASLAMFLGMELPRVSLDHSALFMGAEAK